MTYRLVVVEWLDAYSSASGWKHVDTIKAQRPVLITSMGYVVEDNEDCISLVGSLAADGDCDGDITIPRGMIKTMRELPQ